MYRRKKTRSIREKILARFVARKLWMKQNYPRILLERKEREIAIQREKDKIRNFNQLMSIMDQQDHL